MIREFFDNRSCQQVRVRVDYLPEDCPVCHHSIAPLYQTPSCIANGMGQLVLQCPREKCSAFFIAMYGISRSYQSMEQIGSYLCSLPRTRKMRSFSSLISEVSAAFIEIYGQAEIAEVEGLAEVAGVGFRRSLEFLVKDYLLSIYNDPDVRNNIKVYMLGRCIDSYVSNANVKKVAKRAAWLGNDETHYVRKWEGKDINDLKALIAMTVSWIELERQTLQFEIDMPELTSSKKLTAVSSVSVGLESSRSA